MSVATSPARRRLGTVGAFGLLAVAVVMVLSPGGASGGVRTVLGCAVLVVLPGWLVGRLVDDDGDAVARLVVGAVITLATCVGFAFVASTASLRVATWVAAVPLLVVLGGATAIGVRVERPRARLAPLAMAGLLGLAALGGASVTHLALPSVPVEPSFTIEAPVAFVSPRAAIVDVTVTRVRSSAPSELVLEVGGVRSTTHVAPDETVVRLVATLPAHSASCPRSVLVLAPNGAYLDPAVRCRGW